MKLNEFVNRLEMAKTEEDVKFTYARYFNIKYDTSDRIDLYTPSVIFEFKLNKKMTNIKAIALILAQTLYYIRRLKFHEIDKPIPYYICIADSNEAAITETKTWSNYISSDSYNWNKAPSTPDSKLVDHLVKEPEIQHIHIYKIRQKGEHAAFKKRLEEALRPEMKLDFPEKKIINEENFEAVFDHWKSIIGEFIVNGYKDSFYFLSNIQKERIIVDRDNNKVVFTFEDNNSKVQRILMDNYDYFWKTYDYVTDPGIINGIHAKLDRLTDEAQRRFEGEFYTPLRFAQKAINYFTEVLGKDWYKSGKYRIWDMSAGTGNLEYHLPAESYKYLYMSTLHGSEIDHLKKVFPEATCFQYDYLNDDVDYLFAKDELDFNPDWKLPKRLRDELSNPDITWIVYINPPFATAQDAKQLSSKTGVSKTKVDQWMDKSKMKHAKRELFVQFIYRIIHEFPETTYLGMFSTLKHLVGSDSIEYRNKYFNKKFKKGFLFHSTNFDGVKGDFPIAFLIWDLSKKNTRKTIKIDISDDNGTTIGIKHLNLIQDKKEFLNSWFSRPKNSKDYILPPLSNAITVVKTHTDTRHRARKDFLASICSNGNDFQHAKYVVILSSPNSSAGAFTVTKENFEKAFVLHAVKKIPKPTWLNDRNQFTIPSKEPTKEFVYDCIVWSLFASSNQTSAMKDVHYLEKIYQIKNNFFPFTIDELKSWEIKEPDFKQQIYTDQDRFIANWITDKKLSIESKRVLEAAEVVYKTYFSNLNQMFLKKWKIETWDAGWYQIRRCLTSHNVGTVELNALQEVHNQLASKILPQIEEFGFIDKDEVYDS